MTFGMKSPFAYADLDEDSIEEQIKKLPVHIAIVRPNVDPIAKHQGPGHEIIDGPKVRNNKGEFESYKMCKTCCKEVVDATLVIFSDDDDDNGAVMF